MDWVKNAFAAIRITDDEKREWMQVDSISYTREETEEKAKQTDKDCGPQWAKANRVHRIAIISVSE